MTSARSVRSAEPRHKSVPPALSSAGQEAVELAAVAGLFLDPWQQMVLDGALGERVDKKWAAKEVGLIVPRQNGKGSILEALELASLFLFEDRLILHSAHQFKTAAEAFRRILGLVENCDELRKQCKKPRTSHGEESIELLNGNRLRFVARSTGSGRGFTGDKIILDEAYNLSEKEMAAMLPTLSARPNPQLWYTSSAPTQDVVSQVLRDFCRRGRASDGSQPLAYFEWCAEKEDDQADPGVWAKANPALGIRISEEFTEMERAALGDEFARERLGVWNDDENAGERVIPAEAWLACEDDKSGPVGRVSFALDVTPSRDYAAFAVAGTSGTGGTHLEIVDHRPGTDWLVGRAKDLQEKWGGTLAVSAGSPAASLLAELEAAGVDVLEVSNGDHAQACGALFDAVMQGRVKHLGQPDLTAAVDGADRRFLGDAWLWSRRLSHVDISPLVAATLALWADSQFVPVMAGPDVILL